MEDNILKDIYAISPHPYKNLTVFNPQRDGKDTYGEITQKGTNDLVNHFKKYFNKDTIFYDLGSGLGKMVLHIGMQYNVKKSIGIELSKERYEAAIEIKNKYAKEYNNIEFYNKSLFYCDITDATVIYCDNTVFNADQNQKLYSSIPTGCLFLFKRRLQFKNNIEYEKIYDLVERTYFQTELSWLIKK